MNKIVLSMLGLTLIAGCSGYDYYKTDLRYRQDGEDCIYYYSEDGDRFNRDIRSLEDAKKIVYRNTRCEDLYNGDTFGVERNDRKAIIPVFSEEKPAEHTCGCVKKRTLNKRYIIVPSYAG